MSEVSRSARQELNAAPFDDDRNAWIARYTIDSRYPDCDQTTGPGVFDIFDFI